MKKLILLIPLFFSIECATRSYRFQNPVNSESSKKKGIVVFSIYSVYPKDRNPKLNEFLPTDESFKLSFQDDLISFYDMKQKKEVEFAENIDGGIEDKEKIIYVKKRIRNVSNSIYESYFELELEEGQEYAISRILHGLLVIDKMEYYPYPLDPIQSFETLPLKVKPGEISFMGLYQIRIVNSDANNPFAKKRNKNDMNAMLFGREGFDEVVIGEMRLDNGYIEKASNGVKYNKLQSEITYLKDFILNQKNGYWKEVAQKKIANLSN
ncbi:hypothetical protein LEP1GSC195_3955 [Leptospira wolbachii serovar Codice str. CDC]|uniref:Lipoprotein n=1 Tax=Leptospira wolbachii serovar Codice str. CDC TaxID=1218599 RepID=R8ZXW8_9LEPT|nr:hypothetical protein [Leptospira wolbachii]EOQ94773.1 hypothetical protein LEP1GSC195_3955 [Leptospira wolbachii serovar Codice str. CDC]